MSTALQRDRVPIAYPVAREFRRITPTMSQAYPPEVALGSCDVTPPTLVEIKSTAIKRKKYKLLDISIAFEAVITASTNPNAPARKYVRFTTSFPNWINPSVACSSTMRLL
jgi:hypothetical protein